MAAASYRGRGRRGFALVEQVVAVTVLGVGLLALAGGGLRLQHATRRALLDDAALRVATARVERLSAQPCAAIASGAEDAGPIAERWTVAGVDPVRAVEHHLRYAMDAHSIARRHRTAVLCKGG